MAFKGKKAYLHQAVIALLTNTQMPHPLSLTLLVKYNVMKNHLLILTLLLSFSLTAQISFTKIENSPVSNTPSDSRSINFVDVNNDGWEDLFITNGPGSGQNNMLYINNAGIDFTLLTNDPIVEDNSASDGATFADADNDGDMDAFVVTWHGQKNYFYENNGDGSFTYRQDLLSGSTGTYSETASWGDADNDGWIDLYFTNSYINLINQYYTNNGDLNFSPLNSSILVNESEPSRNVQWIDIDNDNDQDLFITNESNQKNNLYLNDGEGEFTQVENSVLTQSAKGSMSSSWADIDNDGDLDVFVANAAYFQQQNNQLFLNQGNGAFEAINSGDIVNDSGCSYGSAFADIDNDGDEDLIVANGYCNSNLQDYLYINDGQGNFTRDHNSLAALPNTCSFGCAWGDYDKDGFLDLAIAQCSNTTGSPQPINTLFHNDGNTNHWLQIKLEGVQSNRSAIGAIVRTKATINGATSWQMRHITAQSGYCGQNSMIAHFGLGDASQVDSLIVDWPSGAKSSLSNVSIDEQISLTEPPVISATKTSMEKVDISCSPNPVKDQLNINLGKLSGHDVVLQLYDTSGASLYSNIYTIEDQSGQYIKLDLSKKTLPTGVYFVQIRNKNKTGTCQISLY